MKRITLLIPLLLALILTAGCDSPNADFWGDKATIIKKIQNTEDKQKHQARYVIHFDGPSPDWTCVFQEHWGEVGDQVVGGNNHTIITKPKNAINLEDESK